MNLRGATEFAAAAIGVVSSLHGALLGWELRGTQDIALVEELVCTSCASSAEGTRAATGRVASKSRAFAQSNGLWKGVPGHP